MVDYIKTLSLKYPNVQISCLGDPRVYGNLKWEGGDPLPNNDELDSARYDLIKDFKWQEIKKERDRRKATGVNVGGYWFHSDDPSRIQQIGLVMMGANIPANLMWKTMTGEFVLMTQTLASQIFQAVALYDQKNFANAEQHRQTMLTHPDPDNYDFSTGWELTFTDTTLTMV